MSITADEKRSERLSADEKTEVGSGIVDPASSDSKPEPEPREQPVAAEGASPVSSPGVNDDGVQYPGAAKLSLILFALCLAIFLVALDQTIIAPALGAITAQYQSVKDIVRFYVFAFHTSCFLKN